MEQKINVLNLLNFYFDFYINLNFGFFYNLINN